MYCVNLKKFGAIAVEKGLLTEHQVAGCLSTQKTLEKEGLYHRIGDLAIERGLMSAEQVADLLVLQRNRHQRRFLGGFEVFGKLGEGGMGSVYRARRLKDGVVAALKTLSPRVASDEEFLARFRREVELALSLDHPGLVKALEAGQARGIHFVALEFVPGRNLDETIRVEGRLAEARCVDVALQVTRVLDYAHERGFVHRDVKPSNIILAPDGRVKLVDLGLVKVVRSDTPITKKGQAVGTPDYMSPEQIRRCHGVDHRSDFYSLGATMYHMLTGEPPFAADSDCTILAGHLNLSLPSPRDRVPGLSRGICVVLEKMMAKKPEDRYQTAGELEAELERLRQGKPPMTQRLRPGTSTLARSVRDGRWTRRLLGFGALAVAGALFLAFASDPRPSAPGSRGAARPGQAPLAAGAPALLRRLAGAGLARRFVVHLDGGRLERGSFRLAERPGAGGYLLDVEYGRTRRSALLDADLRVVRAGRPALPPWPAPGFPAFAHLALLTLRLPLTVGARRHVEVDLGGRPGLAELHLSRFREAGRDGPAFFQGSFAIRSGGRVVRRGDFYQDRLGNLTAVREEESYQRISD